MDWDSMKKNIAPLYKPFPCSCGGNFFVCEQALCIEPETKKWVDLMTYKCDKCSKTTSQSFEVKHLNEAASKAKLEPKEEADGGSGTSSQ